MGKTSFAMNIVANVSLPRRGEDTEGSAVFSLEMPRSQVALRFACSEAGISFSNARKNFFTDETWTKLLASAGAFSTAPIWIDDTPAISLLDVRARVKKLQRDIKAGRAARPCKRLKLVVVDYLQLMRGVRERGDSRENEVASLSRGLKALAKDTVTTVIAVSQLNRGVERKTGKDRRPELSDLRESGAIEQDADNVWFIYRPDYYDDEARPNEAEAIIRKQRNGETGRVNFRFQKESMRFFELAEQSYEDMTDDFAEDR